jgi:tRNA pseudouridine65 synthase
MSDLTTFEILYEDTWLVVINKPPGILVHRTRLSEDTVFVLQLLRDQLGGAHLFPTHRLDRATSGVLVFAKDADTASWLGTQLMDFKWEKQYVALVRGHFKVDADTIDYPLTDPETGKHEPQQAITHYKVIAQSEMPWPIGLRYDSARFSLVEASPETGRRQQIRKHFAHLRHPIINDTRHGDVKYSKWFKENGMKGRLMLHANKLEVPHPNNGKNLLIEADIDSDFEQLLEQTRLLEAFNAWTSRPRAH